MHDSPPIGALVSVRAKSEQPEGVGVFLRQQKIELGVSWSFDIASPRCSAVEHLVAALAADVIGSLERQIRKRRLDVDTLEATLKAEFAAPLAYLEAVGADGVPKLRSVEMKIFASSGAPEPAVREAWDRALQLAPVFQTLKPGVQFSILLTVSH